MTANVENTVSRRTRLKKKGRVKWHDWFMRFRITLILFVANLVSKYIFSFSKVKIVKKKGKLFFESVKLVEPLKQHCRTGHILHSLRYKSFGCKRKSFSAKSTFVKIHTFSSGRIGHKVVFFRSVSRKTAASS